MRANSVEIAAARTLIAVLAAVGCMVSGACKSNEPAPATPKREPAVVTEPSAAPKAAAPTFRVPPEHTFDLPDDLPVDRAEEERAMRHDCCDEAPASEVSAAVQADDGRLTSPTAKTPSQSPARAAHKRARQR